MFTTYHLVQSRHKKKPQSKIRLSVSLVFKINLRLLSLVGKLKYRALKNRVSTEHFSKEKNAHYLEGVSVQRSWLQLVQQPGGHSVVSLIIYMMITNFLIEKITCPAEEIRIISCSCLCFKSQKESRFFYILSSAWSSPFKMCFYLSLQKIIHWLEWSQLISHSKQTHL